MNKAAKDISAKDLVFDKSNALLQRAERIIPLGSQTFSKSRLQLPVPQSPLFIERGRGGRVWDVDGNEYVDLVCGLLSVTLGYADPDIDNAIIAQLKNGISFSLAHELETELAERLVKYIPCAEMVRFGKNGSDATSAAVRLARAFTGRDHIVTCGYHGWQDWYIGATVRNLGVPKAVSEMTHKVGYNDLEVLEELFKQYEGKIAGLIMEPVSVEEPKPGYLEGVRALTEKYGIVLIFDEIITGFRMHIGGAQSLYNVTPDLASFGKGLANGMPFSAIVGRRDIMMKMHDIFYSGTFGGETLSIAAAIATLDKMVKHNVIGKLWEMGEKLSQGTVALINKYGLENTVSQVGLPPWKITVIKDHPSADKQVIFTKFLLEMYRRGILTGGSHNICYAHTQSDIDQTLKAYDEVLAIIGDELSRGTMKQDLDVPTIMPIFKVRA